MDHFLELKKKCTQVIFKSWSLSDYILGYNTLKIAPNSENGIKVCQMHKNFFLKVFFWKCLGQGKNPESNNKKMQWKFKYYI